MFTASDVIILGAGMAGASLAAELAPHRKVVLVEIEDQPGRHATGRSAAMFFESYGNATVRALTRASRAGFAAAPLLSPRSALFVCDTQRLAALRAMLDAPDAPATLRALSAEAAMGLCPILRPDWIAAAAIDESGSHMDVAAIHQGFIRQVRQAGARLVLGAFEVAIERAAGLWRVRSRAGDYEAPLCDRGQDFQIAALAQGKQCIAGAVVARVFASVGRLHIQYTRQSRGGRVQVGHGVYKVVKNRFLHGAATPGRQRASAAWLRLVLSERLPPI
jgi:choline dehydrogenase-like flavoprotein